MHKLRKGSKGELNPGSLGILPLSYHVPSTRRRSQQFGCYISLDGKSCLLDDKNCAFV